MPPQDTSEIKGKIISLIRFRGPSLPVHIARQINMSILFTSAFLSELFADKRLKISNLRIGSSPLYFIEGQEHLLENFSEHLKSKEREAFLLLKERKFLRDLEQEPAIRVALRAIRDFAIPFRINGEIYWRYITAKESEFSEEKKHEKVHEPQKEKTTEIIKPEKKGESDIFSKEEKYSVSPAMISDETPQKKNEGFIERELHQKKKFSKPRTLKKKIPAREKQSEKFLERVREFLSKSSIEILSIEGMKKDELILKIKNNGSEQLLVAYNKKKISEKEIVKAAKKANEMNLKYSVFSLGELPKKISELLGALQNLREIGKVE